MTASKMESAAVNVFVTESDKRSCQLSRSYTFEYVMLSYVAGRKSKPSRRCSLN